MKGSTGLYVYVTYAYALSFHHLPTNPDRKRGSCVITSPRPTFPKMMDIDMQDQIMEDALMQPQIEAIQSLSGGGSRSESKKPLRIVVDDAHPFDLEGYIAGYTGTCHSDRRYGALL